MFNKASKLITYRVFSARLAKLMCRSDEETLVSICNTILLELKDKPFLPETQKLVDSCIENVTDVTEKDLDKIEEFLAIKMEKGLNIAEIESDYAIINVCWEFVEENTTLKKLDNMIYQTNLFDDQERDEILDNAFNDTLGWYSHEIGK